jgi:hypothetical protein
MVACKLVIVFVLKCYKDDFSKLQLFDGKTTTTRLQIAVFRQILVNASCIRNFFYHIFQKFFSQMTCQIC